MKKLPLFFTLSISIISADIVAQNNIIIPPALSGTEFNLNVQNGSHEFFPGITTTTMGMNGNILGPTLIMEQGDLVNLHVTNNLSDTTTIHWHGMHVSAENDGGPHTIISPGSTWNPSFIVLDRAGTYWYHPHLHMQTNKHVSKGIAGLILVKDSEEAQLTLPRDYGIDDFPIVIQTKDFNANHEIIHESNSDDVVMVNATIDGILEVPAQVVRLRLLNGSSQRVFNFGLQNNMVFHMIASDGGLLEAPVQLTRLRLAPGERAEILLDLSSTQGQDISVMSYASEFQNGIYGASVPGMMSMMTLTGYDPNVLNGTDFSMLTLSVTSPTALPVTTIPNSLSTITPLTESMADETRALTFTPEAMGPNQLNGHFLINGSTFNMNTINFTIPLNNIEIWSITNQSAISHPFHIHDVQFQILDRNGVNPSAEEQGYKDVVLVRPMETVRFITQFSDHANSSIPYMYHCHMLVHEDAGMMGQFVVVDQTNGIQNVSKSSSAITYPNPVKDELSVKTSQASNSIKNILIFDITGKQVLEIEGNNNYYQSLSTESLESGCYLILLETKTGRISERFQKII